MIGLRKGKVRRVNKIGNKARGVKRRGNGTRGVKNRVELAFESTPFQVLL